MPASSLQAYDVGLLAAWPALFCTDLLELSGIHIGTQILKIADQDHVSYPAELAIALKRPRHTGDLIFKLSWKSLLHSDLYQAPAWSPAWGMPEEGIKGSTAWFCKADARGTFHLKGVLESSCDLSTPNSCSVLTSCFWSLNASRAGFSGMDTESICFSNVGNTASSLRTFFWCSSRRLIRFARCSGSFLRSECVSSVWPPYTRRSFMKGVLHSKVS